MAYLYETHLHTKEGSACGRSAGREYIAKYLDLGYTGIIVTDHFYNGNNTAGKHCPWEEWVHEYCRGYENAREEGDRQGLDVFFGWEETFDGDDYLVYGFDKDWLLEHPEVRHWTRQELFKGARRYGGCVVQAHPFRQYHYIGCIRLYTGVDAVEAANSGNQPSFDALAWAYAHKIGLPVTAGSDIHYAGDVLSDVVFGIYMDKKMDSIGDYVDAIRNNTIAGVNIPEGHCDLQGDERILLPVDIRDNYGRAINKDIWKFLGLERKRYAG